MYKKIDRWLSDYERAWSTDDPAEIAALFTAEARYFTAPYGQPLVGKQEIAEWWVEQGEHSLRWTFEHRIVARDGTLYVIHGKTTYLSPDSTAKPETYHNLWLVTLDEDGQAADFVEYWMLED
jgi:uncharacterized protein (TIGR02246 family)